jgi:hypothetical protein
MFLGPALDLTDPLASMFMAGSEAFPQPMWSMPQYYPLGQNYTGAMSAAAAPAVGMSAALPGAASTAAAATSACIRPQKLFNSASAQDGISATLAPSALDLSAAAAALKGEAGTGAGAHHHAPAAAVLNTGPLATSSLLPTATTTPSGMVFPPTSSSYFSLKPDEAAGPTKLVASDQQSPLATPLLPPGGGVLQPVPVGGEDWGQFINDILWE